MMLGAEHQIAAINGDNAREGATSLMERRRARWSLSADRDFPIGLFGDGRDA